MPGAKVRLSGSGTKGKQVNSIKDKKLIKKTVQGLIDREVRYISTIFPYSDRSFYNRNLIYLQGVFFWESLIPRQENIKELMGPAGKMTSLITGLELLGMGISFHYFNAADFLTASQENISETAEEKYTLNLLFGDIFYSRAIIYLLRFRNYKIFGSILNSLKQVHESRLLFHKEILGMLSNNRYISGISGKRQTLLKINHLFRESFYIGYDIFGIRDSGIKIGNIFKIIDHLVILMTYNNLENYCKALPESDRRLKSLLFLQDIKSFINGQLSDIISGLNCERLEKAVTTIRESFT